MTRKHALIEWLPKEDGGRTKPPLGLGSPAYSTEVRFIGQASQPLGEAWFLVVTKRQELDSEYRWLADIHFLLPKAPEEFLEDGCCFELLEGDKCVARGRILVPQDVPAVLSGRTDVGT